MRHTSARRPRGASACCTGSGGTTTAPRRCRPRPAQRSARTAPQAECAASSGASHQRQRKHRPMLMPTSAMALVRTLVARLVGQQRRDGGRHRARALQRAAHEQPMTAGQRRHQAAGGKPPAARTMTRLRPKRSDAMPSGSWKNRLRQAVHAHGQADQGRVVAAGVFARLQRMNTGSTRNRPSMRSAKMAASDMLERRSGPVMRVAGAAGAEVEGKMVSDTAGVRWSGKTRILAQGGFAVPRVGAARCAWLSWRVPQRRPDRDLPCPLLR
jgi:hypothetical protein